MGPEALIKWNNTNLGWK